MDELRMAGVIGQMPSSSKQTYAQPSQNAGQNGVRKSSRSRKKSKKALSLSMSNSTDESDDKKPPPKTAAKKRSQPMVVCCLCGKLLPKRDRSRKKIGVGSGGAGSLRTADGVVKSFCPKCACVIEREKKAKKPSKADREQFEAEGISFGEELAKILNDSEAKRLYCPFYQVRPCGCVQKYISGETGTKKKYKLTPASDVPADLEPPDENANSTERGFFLLSLRTKSLEERTKIVTSRRMKKKTERDIVFPEDFTQFLLSHRQLLRNVGLCERGCQRVLGYSNNFLHKKVTNVGPRLPPSKGKTVVLLTSLEDLASKKCCENKCVKMANTNRDLLTSWRHQAAQNQKLSRQVIVEMLMPNEKKQVNCPKFVALVTGSCKSTIRKIKTSMILAEDGQKALKKESVCVGSESHPSSSFLVLKKPDSDEHSDTTLKAKQPGIPIVAVSSIRPGQPLPIGAGIQAVKASSAVAPLPVPSIAPALPIRIPLNTLVVPQRPLLPKQVLEDRHRKEMAELRRKQEEEMKVFQKQHLQQQQPAKMIVIGQAGLQQLSKKAQVGSNSLHVIKPVPAMAVNLPNATQSSDPSKSQTSVITVALNHEAVRPPLAVSLASSHSPDKSNSAQQSAQVSSGHCLTVPEFLDSHGKPLTSKALSFLLAQPSVQAPVIRNQFASSLPVSSTLLPSSLSQPANFVLGAQEVTSESNSYTVISSSRSSNGSVQSDGMQSNLIAPTSTLGSLELTRQLLLHATPSAVSQTVQSLQPDTLTNNLSKPVSQTEIYTLNKSAQELQTGLTADIDSALNSRKTSATVSSQNLQLGQHLHCQTDLIGAGQLEQNLQTVFSRFKQPTVSAQTGISTSLEHTQNPRTGYSPPSHNMAQAQLSDLYKGIPTSRIRNDCLPASDLQSVEANTLTYSNVSLTTNTVVTSSTEKGHKRNRFLTLNALTQGVTPDPNTVEQSGKTRMSTSISSSVPTVGVDSANEQALLSSNPYYVSDNRNIYRIIQDESQCSVKGQPFPIAPTVSTNILPIPSLQCPSTSSNSSSLNLTSSLQLDPRSLTANIPVVPISCYAPCAQSNVTQPITSEVPASSSLGLKTQVGKTGPQVSTQISSLMPSSIHNSIRGPQNPSGVLCHQRTWTTRDKGQPVIGIVHPHITGSRLSRIREVTDVGQGDSAAPSMSGLSRSTQNHSSVSFMDQTTGLTSQVGQPPQQGEPEERGRELLLSGNSSAIPMETFILGQPSSNASTHHSMAGRQGNQQSNPQIQQVVVPLNQQQTHLKQSILSRCQGVALPQGLTLPEEQLQLLLGANNSQQSQMELQQNNAPVQELPTERQQQFFQPLTQQSPEAQAAPNAQSSSSSSGPHMGTSIMEGVAVPLVENGHANVHFNGAHLLTRYQSFEHLLSSVSDQHIGGNSIHDMQSTVRLAGPADNTDAAQVLIQGQSNSSSGNASLSEVIQPYPHPGTELRVTSSAGDESGTIAKLPAPPTSSTIEQGALIDISLLLSRLASVNSQSALMNVLSEGHSSQIAAGTTSTTIAENSVRCSSSQPQPAQVIKVIEDTAKAMPDDLATQSKDRNSGRKKFIESALTTTPKYSSRASSQGLKKAGKDMEVDKRSEQAMKSGQPSLASYDTVMTLLHESNSNATGSSNGHLNPSTITVLPCPIQPSTNNVANILGGEILPAMAGASSQQVCIQLPPHEVPVIQHTVDQKRIFMLSHENGSSAGSFTVPKPSSQDNQQVILNISPSQESANIAQVISPANTNSIIPPIQESCNESRMARTPGPTLQSEKIEAYNDSKQLGLLHQNFETLDQLVKATQDLHQNSPSLHQQSLFNILGQSTPSAQTSSDTNQTHITQSLPVSNSQTSQSLFLHTDNQAFSGAQTHLSHTQANQITMTSEMASGLTPAPEHSGNSIGLSDSHVSASFTNTMPLVSSVSSGNSFVTTKEAKSRGNTVILVPDKPGFPRYQITQLSPELGSEPLLAKLEDSATVTPSLLTSPPSNINVSPSQQDSIIQLIAQTLMNQNLTLTDGTQIVLPFPTSFTESLSVLAKPDSIPSHHDESKINGNACEQRGDHILHQEKAISASEMSSSILSSNSLQKLQLAHQSTHSFQSPLTKAAMVPAFQSGNDQVELKVAGELSTKIGQGNEAAAQTSTHIIGDMRIGSLVKTKDGNDISSTAVGHIRANTEATESSNASLVTVNLQKAQMPKSGQGAPQAQTSVAVSQKNGATSQPAIMLLRGTDAIHTVEGSIESAQLSGSFDHNLTENSNDATLAILRGANLTPVRTLYDGSSLDHDKSIGSYQGIQSPMAVSNGGSTGTTFSSTIHNAPQLHCREHVIDVSDECIVSPSSHISGRYVQLEHKKCDRLQGNIQPTVSEVFQDCQSASTSGQSSSLPQNDTQNPQRLELLTTSKEPPLSSLGEDQHQDDESRSLLRSMMKNTETFAAVVKYLKNAESEFLNSYSGRESASSQSVAQSSHSENSFLDTLEKCVPNTSQKGSQFIQEYDAIQCASIQPSMFDQEISASPSSVVVSLESHNGTQRDKTRHATGGLAQCDRKRPISTSQLNSAEVSQNEECQSRHRTRSTGTSSNNDGSLKVSQAHSYPNMSLSSSAVTFTRDTTSANDSVGPPNVTLVSPSALKRKQLQELENAAVVSQNRERQAVDVVNASLPLLSIADNQVGAKSGSDNYIYAPAESIKLLSGAGAHKIDKNQKQESGRKAHDVSFKSRPFPVLDASRQSKAKDKTPCSKSRKHFKRHTIRYILNQMESGLISASTALQQSQGMHSVLPVPEDTSVLSSDLELNQLVTAVLEAGQHTISPNHNITLDVANKRPTFILPKKASASSTIGLSGSSDLMSGHKGKESPSPNIALAECKNTKLKHSQISDVQGTKSSMYSTKSLSHQTHIQWPSTSSPKKIANIPPDKSIFLAQPMARGQDHTSGFIHQHQYSTTFNNVREDSLVGEVVTSMPTRKVKYGVEPVTGVYQETVHPSSSSSRKNNSTETEKVKDQTDVVHVPSSLESSQSHHLCLETRDKIGNQSQQDVHHIVEAPLLGLPRSRQEKGLHSRRNEPVSDGAQQVSQEQVVHCTARNVPSARTHALTSDFTETSGSSHQPLLFTASHNFPQRDLSLNTMSQMRPETSPGHQRQSSIQNLTPLLSQMLQSSPVSLRPEFHLKGEHSVSMAVKDSRMESECVLTSTEKMNVGKDEQKGHQLIIQTSTAPDVSDFVQERFPETDCSEPLSAGFSKTSKGRITQVIDNIYHRQEKDTVGTEDNVPSPSTVQIEDTVRSSVECQKRERGSFVCEPKLNAIEDNTQGQILPRKRKSRKRTISNNSDPNDNQPVTELLSSHNTAHYSQQGTDPSVSESRSGKRMRSRKDGGGRERKKSAKFGASGHCQQKRVQFSDVINDDNPVSPHTKSPTTNARAKSAVTSSPDMAVKDGIYASSNSKFQSTYSHSQFVPGVMSKSSGRVHEEEGDGLIPQFAQSSHAIHSSLSPEETYSRTYSHKDHYNHGSERHTAMIDSNRVESNYWLQQPSTAEDFTKGFREHERDSESQSLRHYPRPSNPLRSFEPRKETEFIESHSHKNDGKTAKTLSLATDNYAVSPSLNFTSRSASDHKDTERKESTDRAHEMPWSYIPEEQASSFEIISAYGYSKLSQQLKKKASMAAMSVGDYTNSSVLSSPPEPSSTASKDARDSVSLSNLWQGSEDSDMDMSRLDKTIDPSVKRQKALQSDYELAQQMAQHQSHILRHQSSSQDAGHQPFDNESGYASQPGFSESNSHDFAALDKDCHKNVEDFMKHTPSPIITESELALLSVYHEHLWLKRAVAKATETQSRQRNLSAVDKQKNGSEPDMVRRYASMPSSPFEADSIRRSPRTMSFGKYPPSLSRGQNSSSQESRSRNASGSYALNQHYGELEHPFMSDLISSRVMDFDVNQGEPCHPQLAYNSFIPVTNLGFTVDNDVIMGYNYNDTLRFQNYLDSEYDGHNRHRNLSSSSGANGYKH